MQGTSVVPAGPQAGGRGGTGGIGIKRSAVDPGIGTTKPQSGGGGESGDASARRPSVLSDASAHGGFYTAGDIDIILRDLGVGSWRRKHLVLRLILEQVAHNQDLEAANKSASQARRHTLLAATRLPSLRQ